MHIKPKRPRKTQRKRKRLNKTTSVSKKRKILQLRKEGLTAAEVQKRTGASPLRQQRILNNKKKYIPDRNENYAKCFNRNAKGAKRPLDVWVRTIDEDLNEDFKEMRKKGIKVGKKDIIQRTFLHCKQKNVDIPSNTNIPGFLRRFRIRHKINPQRRVTRSYCQDEKIIAQRCVDFIENVKRIKNSKKINDPDDIWCLDEVGIFDGVVDKNTKTWHYIGDHEIKMKDVKNPKKHHTVILMFNASGKTRIAVVLKKGSKAKIPKSKWEVTGNMYVCNVKDKSWISEEGWKDFIKEIIWKSETPQLIQFDEATGHMNLETIDYLTASGFNTVLTPGETSQYVQPNDQYINSSFKKSYDQKKNDYIKQCVHKNNLTIYNPPFEEMCRMIA